MKKVTWVTMFDYWALGIPLSLPFNTIVDICFPKVVEHLLMLSPLIVLLVVHFVSYVFLEFYIVWKWLNCFPRN